MANILKRRERRGVIGLISGETEETLLQIKTPEKTRSYTPVPYKLIIDSMKKELAWREFNILNIDYRTSNKGNRIVGLYKFSPKGEIISDEKDRLVRMIGFRSSHDKTMSFGVFSGANVFVCANGVYSSEVSYTKRHMSNVDEMVKEKIHEQLNLIEASFLELQEFREMLKEITFSKKAYAQILGRLIFEKEVLTSTQINIIKDHRRFSEYFSDDSAWSLYNNITEALKVTNPILYQKHHLKVYDLFQEVILGK